jgi:hypothetical protein
VTFFVDPAHRNVIASQLKLAADSVVPHGAAWAFASGHVNGKHRWRPVRAATEGAAFETESQTP